MKIVINTLTFDNLFLFVIETTYEFHRFFQTRLRNTKELSDETKQIIVVIVASHFAFIFSTFNFRLTISKRATSVEFVDFSIEWNTDINRFRRAYQKFRKHIVAYKASSTFRNFIEIRDFTASSTFNFSIDETSKSKRRFFESNVFRVVTRFVFDLNDIFIFDRKRAIENVITFNVFFLTNHDQRNSSSLKRSNTRATFDTSIEKIVYHQSIESQSSSNNMTMTSKQINQMIKTTIDRYATRHSIVFDFFDFFELSDFVDFQKDDNLNVDNVNNDNSRWNVVDVDFFDSMHDEKFVHIDDFITQIEKNTYFRNVDHFIRRVNDIIIGKKAKFVRQNLWMCFRKIVLNWWTIELIDNEKLMIILIFDVDDQLQQWIRLLHDRFKFFFNITLNALFNERYTLRDAINKREFKKYVQKILLLTKIVNLNSAKNQLNIIYNEIDSSFRKKNVKRFKNDDIVNNMLKLLNDCKHDWWNYEVKTMRVQNKSQLQSQKFLQNDQYDFKNNNLSISQRRSFFLININSMFTSSINTIKKHSTFKIDISIIKMIIKIMIMNISKINTTINRRIQIDFQTSSIFFYHNVCKLSSISILRRLSARRQTRQIRSWLINVNSFVFVLIKTIIRSVLMLIVSSKLNQHIKLTLKTK